MSGAATWLAGRQVCICAGSGGVGKTTTAAALALGMAARGQRVAVVTIDPARRLAQALGLDALGNEPRRLDTAPFAARGVDVTGELWAMTLDPKRTFDELVVGLAPNTATREAILGNRIYRQLSTAVAGSQEWTAVAKLDELQRSGRFDLVVLDTPPSRNALDFVDAPGRLTALLHDRTLHAFAAPGGAAAALGARGTGAVLALMRRVTGVDLLGDLGAFFSALSGVFDGFAERTERVQRLLADPATTFVLVSGPDHGTVQETIFLRRRLRDAGMAFGGLVVNRVHPLAAVAPSADPADVAAALGTRDAGLADRAARTLGELRTLAERDDAALRRLRRELGRAAPLVVPELDGDVHDAAGIAAVCGHLFAAAPRRAELLERVAI